MAPTTPSPDSKAPPFLTLPLEIRLMVYKLLAHQNQPLKRPRGWRDDQIIRQTPHSQYGHSSSNFHGWENMLCSLRATCRQLYRETFDLISYPGFTVHFRDGLQSLQSTELVPKATASFTRNKFVQENLVNAWFNFACYLKPSQCCHKSDFSKGKQPLLDWVSFAALRKMFLKRVKNLSWRYRIDGPLYREMVTALQGCPLLEEVYMFVSHGDILDWWGDPTRDFAPWVPLLQRGVVVYKIVSFSRPRNKHDAYRSTSDALDWGGGDVVMVRVRLNYLDAGKLRLRQYE